MNTFDTPKNGKATRGRSKSANGAAHGTSDERSAAPPGLEHRQILAALRAFKRGDFTVKMREDLTGVDGQIAETFNDIVELVKTIRDEASDVSTSVGKQGQAAKRMRRFC